MSRELGPLLGRLLAPMPEGHPAGLDEVRLAMLTGLFEGAAFPPSAWVEAWQRTAARAAAVVAADGEARIRDAAAASRFPAARLVPLLPTAEDRQLLESRFSAAGLPLEAAAAIPDVPPRQLAGALEQSWERLLAMAREESGGFEFRASAVRAWQRPWRPLVLGGVAAGLVALWVGLMLGGYLPVPAPLRPMADWYWSLSWP